MASTLEFLSPFSARSRSLQEVLGQKMQTVRSKVAKDIKAVITSGSEEQYIHALIQESTVSIPQFDFEPEHIEKTDRYEDVPGDFGQMVKQWVITFKVPYTGDISLLQYIPRSGVEMWYPNIFLQGSHACFEVKSRGKDPGPIRQEKERILTFLQKRVAAAAPELEAYNQAIVPSISQIVEHEKQRYNDDNNLLQQL